MVKIQLAYDRVKCPRCGDTSRIVGVVCATCGASPAPTEANTQLQRRRRFSGEVRSALTEQPVPELVPSFTYSVLGAMFRRVGGDLDELLTAISDASKARTPFDDGKNATAAARRIIATSAALCALSRDRPARSTIDHLRYLSSQNRAILESYLAALDAATPLEAQSWAEEAQSFLDESAARIDQLRQIRDAAAILEEDDGPQTIVLRLFSTLRLIYPGRRVTQLEDLGRARFQEITGVSGASGTGLGTLGMELAASAHLDRDRFADVLSRLARGLAPETDQTRAMFAEPRVRRDIRRALEVSLEAYAQLALLFPRASSDEAAFRQILKLYKSMFEDVMAPLAAALLLATGASSKPYARLLLEDASELARRVNATQALGGVLAGVVPGYRNAESHGAHSYSLEGSEVAFSLRTFTARVPVAEFVNDCFALIESLIALQLALSNQFALLGYTDHQPDDLGYFQPSQRQLAEFLLQDQGIEVVALEVEREQWSVSVREQPRPITALASGLETLAPETVQRFVIRNETNGRLTTVEIERTALREMRDYEDSEPVWGTIVALVGTRRDGASILTGHLLRCAVAAVGIEALTRRNVDRIPRLRRMRELAVVQADKEAVDLLVVAMRAIRTGGESQAARRPEWQAWIADGDLTLP